jgi:hypothetical protein
VRVASSLDFGDRASVDQRRTLVLRIDINGAAPITDLTRRATRTAFGENLQKGRETMPVAEPSAQIIRGKLRRMSHLDAHRPGNRPLAPCRSCVIYVKVAGSPASLATTLRCSPMVAGQAPVWHPACRRHSDGREVGGMTKRCTWPHCTTIPAFGPAARCCGRAGRPCVAVRPNLHWASSYGIRRTYFSSIARACIIAA